ncbi:hypothetical protein O181_028800 [Austropuccinia psidii MF-1]|uniref:Uncharacterized protein n=1 Tax=Austropuccinia psidii MF-1 TaxID=1389203 RepID=A0A9Q3H4K6_9BASI|nr:hypothetical protein [Austropuccinia psidii MF-1]
MVITKGWNSNRQFKPLEERATRIRENQATIQAIEERLNQTEPTMIPSGSQGADQPNSPVAKSHHYSQFQVVSRRRQSYKGKNKTSFNPSRKSQTQ